MELELKESRKKELPPFAQKMQDAKARKEQERTGVVNTMFSDVPTQFDHNKIYQFELVNTYELYKPTDEKSGKKIDSLYPPFYSIPNTGRAYDEATKRQRKFRFLANEESIWADEQNEIELKEEAQLLALSENQLDFINGKLLVTGKEENKIKALLIQDSCENKSVKIKEKPAEYRLINPETAITQSLDGLDKEFEAIKVAGEATLEEMKEFAYALGINIQQSDNGIKRDFYMQAKANPSHFLKNFVNPLNKLKYMLYNAISENIVSPNLIENQLVWVENRTHICNVNAKGDVVTEVANKSISGDKNVNMMFDQLRRMD